MKISKEILDNIVEQLGDGGYNDDGCNCATYEDAEKDIYIEASVMWQVERNMNWVNVDGCRYLEGIYTELVDFDDLQVGAWIGNDKVDVDIDYIERELKQYI